MIAKIKATESLWNNGESRVNLNHHRYMVAFSRNANREAQRFAERAFHIAPVMHAEYSASCICCFIFAASLSRSPRAARCIIFAFLPFLLLPFATPAVHESREREEDAHLQAAMVEDLDDTWRMDRK